MPVEPRGAKNLIEGCGTQIWFWRFPASNWASRSAPRWPCSYQPSSRWGWSQSSPACWRRTSAKFYCRTSILSTSFQYHLNYWLFNRDLTNHICQDPDFHLQFKYPFSLNFPTFPCLTEWFWYHCDLFHSFCFDHFIWIFSWLCSDNSWYLQKMTTLLPLACCRLPCKHVQSTLYDPN